jgi:MtN3 and saliva related transmembrane protein
VNSQLINVIGLMGAALSTVCLVPQAVKIVRDKETRAISLVSTIGWTVGGMVWIAYGVARGDWPLIASSGASLAFTLVILRLKLRYG